MLRLTDVRPTSRVRSVSGTTAGAPTLGSGSGTPWEAYQSGSTQISATQLTASGPGATGAAAAPEEGGVSDGAGIGGGTGCRSAPGTPSGGVSGRGSCPVV